MSGRNPVVNTAKKVSETGEEFVTLADGRRGRIVPVSSSLISSVVSSIPEPDIPEVFIEAKGRSEPNPNDPGYLRALGDYERDRGIATMDAMVMFGLELIDGLPEDEGWLKKLTYMDRRGILDVDLEDFDLEDELDREFLYKKYILGNAALVSKITRISGLTEEDIVTAEDSFRSPEA